MAVEVFVVEDHPVMRETIVDYLTLEDDIEVCGVAATAEEARAALESLEPQVVLLDLSLPGRNGLEFLEEMSERSQTAFVILSGHGERSYVRRALASGARGYILKGAPEDVVVAIRTVAAGGTFLSSALADV